MTSFDLAPFESLWDWVGVVLYVLVFPVYHLAYHFTAAGTSKTTRRDRFDALRESWIQRLLDGDQVTVAAQQTRNLTMVSSILVSASLILLGITANMLVRVPQLEQNLPHSDLLGLHPNALRLKLYCLIVVFVAAFSFCMTALRYLGNFVLAIGADPAVIEEHFGSAVGFLSGLVNTASHRYTLGVRSFYAAFPLMGWLFDSRLFVFLTSFWALRFFTARHFGGSAVENR